MKNFKYILLAFVLLIGFSGCLNKEQAVYDIPSFIGKSSDKIIKSIGTEPFFYQTGDNQECAAFYEETNSLVYCYTDQADQSTEFVNTKDKITNFTAEFTFLEGEKLNLKTVAKRLNMPILNSKPAQEEPSPMELGQGKPGLQIWEKADDYESVEASYYYGTQGSTIYLLIAGTK